MNKDTHADIVGGGVKKVLYTLSTIKRIGLLQSAKALNAKNTCKACAFGMGGQLGGMTNELGEFPSVCNKSIQAQSTDIQKPIPDALFAKHPLQDFEELSAKEIENLGRLATPLYKSADSTHYQPIDWDKAFSMIVAKMLATPAERSFFYSSGRSSNEAGFVLQLLARLYGTNNVNNCSYYCHQATGVGLSSSIGTGTATIELDDLSHCDLLFVIGANPSSNHPRFIHQLKAIRERGGHVVIINPAKEPGLVKFAVPKSAKSMFSGGSDIASEYLQPRIGSDLFLLKGLAKAIIALGAQDRTFIEKHCKDYESFLKDIESITWETITHECGIAKHDIENIAQMYARSQSTVFAWGMGITHHTHGSENVEYIANLALLRGMIGQHRAGLLPLRGHSNVQGIGTVGVKPALPKHVFERMQEHFNVNIPTQKGMDTIACLEAADRGEIDFALLMGGNLLSASPHTTWTKNALDTISCKVFLTTTLNHGHVSCMESSESLVLPVTARDEEWEPTTQESMFNFVRMSDGGISRLENIKPETTILSTIAKALFPDSEIDFDQFQKHRSIRDAIAEIIPGMEKIKNISTSKKEFHIDNRIIKKPNFTTPSGKAHFRTTKTMIKTPCEQYPLTLMTTRSEGQFNSIIYEEKDSYRDTDNRWCVLLSTIDMEKLSLSKHDTVTLSSAYGRMEKVWVYPFDLPAGNCMAYFPEANVLIGKERDPRSQTPAFKSVNIHVAKD